MSKRRYTKAEKATLTQAAEQLRDRGLEIREAASVIGVPTKTLWRWVRTRHKERPPMVDHDGDCWRIYVYDPAREDDQQQGTNWWALNWLRFATREAAECHLAWRGPW